MLLTTLALALTLHAPATPRVVADRVDVLLLAQSTGGRFGGSSWSRGTSPASGASGTSGTSSTSSTSNEPGHERSSSHESDDSGAGGLILLLVILALSKLFTWLANLAPLAGASVLATKTLLLFRLGFSVWPWQVPDALFRGITPPPALDPELPRERGALLGLFGASLAALGGLCLALARRLGAQRSSLVEPAMVRAYIVLLAAVGAPAVLAGVCVGIAALATARARRAAAERAWGHAQLWLGLLLCVAFWFVGAYAESQIEARLRAAP